MCNMPSEIGHTCYLCIYVQFQTIIVCIHVCTCACVWISNISILQVQSEWRRASGPIRSVTLLMVLIGFEVSSVKKGGVKNDARRKYAE